MTKRGPYGTKCTKTCPRAGLGEAERWFAVCSAKEAKDANGTVVAADLTSHVSLVSQPMAEAAAESATVDSHASHVSQPGEDGELPAPGGASSTGEEGTWV